MFISDDSELYPMVANTLAQFATGQGGVERGRGGLGWRSWGHCGWGGVFEDRAAVFNIGKHWQSINKAFTRISKH